MKEGRKEEGILMTSMTTSYTTYDLAYYYADLKHIPPLSDEEQHHLLTSTPPGAPCLETAARNRLIEGHLGLASHIALAECPPTRPQRVPDILGEVNLALVKAAGRFAAHSGGDVTAYLAAYMRGGVKRALGEDTLIRIPSSSRSVARVKGTLEQLYALEPLSLDAVMEGAEGDEHEELALTPLLPTQAAPVRDPAQRAQVETYLSYLSSRAQAILRLRYGLSEENERAHSTAEIVQALGISRSLVHHTERDALARLQALVTGEATIVNRRGTACISLSPARRPAARPATPLTLTPAQETTFRQAAARLSEEGVKLTRERLAQAAGLGINRAQVFLSAHRDRQQERHARLARAYARLETQGERVTYRRLGKAAHASKQAAMEFLRATQEPPAPIVADRSTRPQQGEAPQWPERLEEACRQIEAQGRRVSIEGLMHTAHAGRARVLAFLQMRKAGERDAAE
jgi:RNA polymerase sigma factor (sigma-70 family)